MPLWNTWSSGRQQQETQPPHNPELWSPFFISHKDFEVAEVLMKLGACKADCNHLLKVFRWCLDGKGSLNLNKYSDINDAWKCTLSQLTSVSSQVGRGFSLTGLRFSLSTAKFRSHTKVKLRRSRYLIIHYGIGRLISSWTSTWLHILNGMHGRLWSMRGQVSLVFIPSHGSRKHFGTFKYTFQFISCFCLLYFCFENLNWM